MKTLEDDEPVQRPQRFFEVALRLAEKSEVFGVREYYRDEDQIQL